MRILRLYARIKQTEKTNERKNQIFEENNEQFTNMMHRLIMNHSCVGFQTNERINIDRRFNKMITNQKYKQATDSAM